MFSPTSLMTEYVIRSLSVTSQRLLVTSCVPSRVLRVHSTIDAAHIGVVELPQYMSTCKIVICHSGYQLYTADCNVQSIKQMEMEYDIMSLSATSQRLLM